MDAAAYYCNNYDNSYEIIMNFDKTQAVCIEECQEVLQNDQLIFTKFHFMNFFYVIDQYSKT